MNQSKISVIIPVYNSEKYLQRCLDSVIGQTLQDIEVICINDASTDKSLDILNSYANKYAKIKVYNNKENKGPGFSRNIGIQESIGEYISFIDSDDYYDSKFLELLYTDAKNNNCDILKGIYYYVDIEVQNIELNKKIELNKNYFCGEFCSAIFRSKIIKDNNIQFKERYDCEDPVFALETSIYSNSIKINNNAIVYITSRDNSVSRFKKNKNSFNKIKIKDRFYGLSEIYNISINNNIKEDVYLYILAKFIELIFLDTANLKIDLKCFFASTFINFYNTLHNKNNILEYINCNILKNILKNPNIDDIIYYIQNKNLIYLNNKLHEAINSYSIMEELFYSTINKNYSKIITKNKTKLHIVSVVNDYSIYHRCIGENKFITNRENIELSIIDNTIKNKFISVRYNEFINKINEESWILFCHSDFEILEDIIPKIESLDKRSLYGPIGSKCEILYNKDNIDYVIKKIVGTCLERRRDGTGLRRVGIDRKTNCLADTFDCQALLVHSTLIKKYNLYFDENLPFDLYVEDFCISSLLNYNIKSYIIDICCCHWSGYHITPQSYYTTLKYINNKYNDFLFSGTVSLLGGKKHIDISNNQKEISSYLRKKIIYNNINNKNNL